MFNSTVLEIAIGIVSIYLVLGMVVTATTELLANWFRSRAMHLEQGVRSLLLDQSGAVTSEIYNHPLIQGLSNINHGVKYRKPSYIPSATFALAFLQCAGVTAEVLKGASGDIAKIQRKLPDGPWKTALESLIRESNADYEVLKTRVEMWFNDSMERVSGWYKRKTQWVTLWIALLLVLVLNIDTLKISQTLANVPAVRVALTEEGERLAKEQNIKDLGQVEAQYQDVASLGIPLGWVNGTADFYDVGGNSINIPKTFRHVLGWLLTAVAASLGAPFWFDVLNKIINIRAAGRSPSDAPRAPGVLPAPRA